MIADHDRVSLRATVDDSTTDADIPVSLGLIVAELVINALKHAFPGRGRIKVDDQSLGNSWTMVASDDDVGLPPAGNGGMLRRSTDIVHALSK